MALSTNQKKNISSELYSALESLVNNYSWEINTIIVSEINPSNFNAWEVYRDIYPISRSYLQQIGVDRTLSDRYLDLRKKLELEYAILLTDPNSDFYDTNYVARVRQDLQILTNPNINLEEIQTLLPPLEQVILVQKLLQNSRFIQRLRVLGEVKESLDNQNKKLLQQQSEVNYAQTVISLDGKITNRYASEILEHPQKDIILQLHQQSVESGQKQWRRILGLALEILRKYL